MRSSILAIFLAAALLTGFVAACGAPQRGEGGESGRGEARGAQVPEGVAAQYATLEDEVRAEGGETTSGPWRIAYIVEPAEGWFERRGDEFTWRPPARGETHHIEILPIEAKTGRLVPEVPVTLEVLDAAGERVARKRLRSYYAEFFHYAENFSIPERGEYTLRATLEPPSFRRYGEEQEGPALAERAEVEFEGVRLEPEQE
jgi:hypothetical protein